MKPQEVTDSLKLNQLKDKIWYVVPSCATTGEGLLEGLVSHHYSSPHSLLSTSPLTHPRPGSQTTSSPPPRNPPRNKRLSTITKSFTVAFPSSISPRRSQSPSSPSSFIQRFPGGDTTSASLSPALSFHPRPPLLPPPAVACRNCATSRLCACVCVRWTSVERAGGGGIKLTSL